jgi:hypothetical protein
MNIYLLEGPTKPSINPIFAHVGTWSDGKVCKSCGKTSEKLIEPLLIDWDDGSVHIGDFSWCGYTAVVLDRVKQWMLKNKFEVRFGRSEVVKPTGKAKMPRVAFPYTGPDLHWLICEKFVRLDEEASGIKHISSCPVCGQERTQFLRENIFIPKDNWNGEKIFEVHQNGKSGAMFLTEVATELLAKQGFKNHVMQLAGRIG